VKADVINLNARIVDLAYCCEQNIDAAGLTDCNAHAAFGFVDLGFASADVGEQSGLCTLTSSTSPPSRVFSCSDVPSAITRP
jgi:hypothetical protein